MPSAKLKVCEEGSDGALILPLFGEDEQGWPAPLRVLLYGIGLVWCFLGVAIVADVFMGSIEVITSKKTRRLDPATQKYTTAEVWNPTVANLTLMALGSSAPEILLSVIELLGSNFFSGDLGPSTIVGSAAFNLMCIIAVCVMAIPEGELRRIKEMPVYACTASFSIFAYLWLLIILLGPSPNVIEPWEGCLTLLLFPVLVTAAFLADKGLCSPRSGVPKLGPGIVLSEDLTKQELAELDARIRREYGRDLTGEQVLKIARIECTCRQSRARHRVSATRAISGGRRVTLALANAGVDDLDDIGGPAAERLRTSVRRRSSCTSNKVLSVEDDQIHNFTPMEPQRTFMEFAVSSYAVLENAGSVKVSVRRDGNMNSTATVDYKTRDGQAVASSDYIHCEGTLTFGPGESEKWIEITIMDDVAYEDDEDFFLDLSSPTSNCKEEIVELGPISTTTIVIIDDDLPGVISFPEDVLRVSEDVYDQEVKVDVLRKHGSTGQVTCMYKTESSGAKEGQDFEEACDRLVFKDKETRGKIKVKIKARGRYDCTEDFHIILYEVTGGAKFDRSSDGGSERCVLTVFIESDKAAKDRVDRLMSAVAANWKRAKVGHANWCEQFHEALYVNGGGEDDEDEAASVKDWILHFVTLPWKLFFAFVPPTDYCGGWICFCCSLLMIGVVTAFIGDLAALFGCALGLPDEVTAITFVALGTSLPDTFASKTAALADPDADASIGNVTGSNSVNVFLGLGLPWTLGSIYWRVNPSDEWMSRFSGDQEIPAAFRESCWLVVKAGNLAFSVTVFVGCASTCICLLYVRRRYCGGELGGPRLPKRLSAVALVSLWFLYVGLSSWRSVSSSDD